MEPICGLTMFSNLPQELLWFTGSAFLDCVASAAHLSTTCRTLRRACLADDGRLRVVHLTTSSVTVVEQLGRLSTRDLEELRIDLWREKRGKLSTQRVEAAMDTLAEVISRASRLRILTVRLAPFSSSYDRLRLGRECWDYLIAGLASLASFQKLQVLEMSNFTIKVPRGTGFLPAAAAATGPPSTDEAAGVPRARVSQNLAPAIRGSSPSGFVRRTSNHGVHRTHRQLTRAASSPTRKTDAHEVHIRRSAAESQADAHSTFTMPPSFMDALGSMSSLEELSLLHCEIFSTIAALLPPALRAMPRLRKLDLTRNFISRQCMASIRDSLPTEVTIIGEGSQTFYFY